MSKRQRHKREHPRQPPKRKYPKPRLFWPRPHKPRNAD